MDGDCGSRGGCYGVLGDGGMMNVCVVGKDVGVC